MAILSLDRQKQIDAQIEDILLSVGKAYPRASLLDIIHGYAPGVKVSMVEFGEDSDRIKGLIEYDDGKPSIVINKNRKNPYERTFTLAHEFGHYVLHKDANKLRLDLFNYAENTKESLEESEANYFAASLLMPRHEFKDLLNLTSDMQIIAQYFGVSVTAATKRKEWLDKNKTA